MVEFKINSKLMKACCEWQSLSMRQIRFQFDRQGLIDETGTPAQLDMEDDNTIDVYQQQTGGAY